MDGSALVGIASAISLSDAGVVLGLILLGWLLYRHTVKDSEDRRRHYERMEQMEQRIEDKIENLRLELRSDHKELAAKVDELSKDVAVLNGYHKHERDK